MSSRISCAGDPQEARNAMWAHLEETARLVTQVVQKTGRTPKNGRRK